MVVRCKPQDELPEKALEHSASKVETREVAKSLEAVLARGTRNDGQERYDINAAQLAPEYTLNM
jgi:hypothetical protein